ncbi:hypothetical protein TCAL_03177 [Tigriopus californicus]|uniref:Borealin C-terminal domain-containing protein n=1 Tax=Tigriopus californicus TaxID=6832 RepID=A0A553N8X0_TIGCA|nr:uncharacterized protein LOC131885294 [Tigriopus californicus]TRY61881.1 hypothetical protein TCAL_03177 [Tigriopus californicus]|eukprot:TCALIF_03177-PA protein Name:"Protein of unknown function" AED:0.00 eAED:0.00 QI:33/1/1/1/1/1/3/138/300
MLNFQTCRIPIGNPIRKMMATNAYMEDFDNQFLAKLDGILASRDAFLKNLKACTHLAILNIPKSQRKKTLAELNFFPDLVAAQVVGGQTGGQTGAQPTLKPAGGRAPTHGPSLDPGQSVAQQIHLAVQAQLKSSQKRGRPAGGQKTPAPARAKGALAPPSTGVRRSTRKRGPPSHLDTETPVMAQRNRAASSLATPMITPKFDVNTPFNKSVFRLALPNEKLVSLSGSPVCASTVKASKSKKPAKDHWPIPLGQGKTIMIPMNQADAEQNYVDLDEDAKNKLMQVRSALDSLIRMKAADD